MKTVTPVINSRFIIKLLRETDLKKTITKKINSLSHKGATSHQIKKHICQTQINNNPRKKLLWSMSNNSNNSKLRCKKKVKRKVKQ